MKTERARTVPWMYCIWYNIVCMSWDNWFDPNWSETPDLIVRLNFNSVKKRKKMILTHQPKLKQISNLLCQVWV